MSNVTPLPANQRRLAPFEAFSPIEWQGRTPPALDWMVENCVLRGTVCMLSGDGGLGKSLLMQQLLTCAALGQDWLGMKVAQCRGLGFFCEDDKDELWRRQQSINTLYGTEMGDLEDVWMMSRVGAENVLMEFDRRDDTPKPTPIFAQLRQKVLDVGAQLIVLDTLADVFAGNEIIRNQVRRFVSALRKLALETNGAVILTAHPSLAGLNSGSGISGSTAWNNSVRSRLYLTKPKPKNGEEDDDGDIRLLKTMKSNQSKSGGQIEIRWEHGAFVRVDAPVDAGPLDKVDQIDLKVSVLKAVDQLCRNGTRMSPDKFARTYVVKALMQHPMTRRFTRGQIEGVKDTLLADKRLAIVEIGPPSKRQQYIRTDTFRFADEEGKP